MLYPHQVVLIEKGINVANKQTYLWTLTHQTSYSTIRL